ncbi:MAG: Gfo/Idh/MocA family oxidoreductase [Verrucomicrobia bacterium]|nr:Gfo/Idh/MocA family oxidoreductase [Verrucomicrobiota bacterium]
MRNACIKVGVVGVGHLGKEHARIYSQLGECDLVGVHDLNSKLAESIARKTRCRSFDSLEELASSVDAVSVVVPTIAHHGVARFFLERGRDVFIEKPITETTAQAEDLVRLAQEKQRLLQVGHIERFNPVLSYLEKNLREPRFIEAHRLSSYPGRGTDVSVVLDLMIHDLDVILHLVKAPLVAFDAVGVAVLSSSEDIANVRLKFADGCVANITTSRISPEKLRKIRVFSSDSYISLDYQNQEGLVYWKEGGVIKRDTVPVVKDEPLKVELASFVESVRRRSEPKVSGADAKRALDMAVAIIEQIRHQTPMPPSSASPGGG